MSRRYQRLRVVSCGNCGANFDASGPDPRCPACDKRLADYEAGEAMPAVRGYGRPLESPEYMRTREQEEPETAPPEDFVAAGLVFFSFVLIVGAIVARSPLLLNVGLALFALSGIGYGLFKLQKIMTGKQKRRDRSQDGPSMLDWFIGRGFWDRWR